jgi:phosphatidylglycerophosphate synthase
MLSHKKTHLEKYFEPLASRLSRVNPNLLTLVGSIPSLFFFVFLNYHWYVPALIIFLGMSLDMLDGLVARRWNKTTAFGGFLDSFMDRVSDFLVITAFSFSGLVRWNIAAPLLLFAFLTSYARSRGELAKTGANFAVGIIERTERLMLIFIALLFYTFVPNLTVNGFNAAEVVFIIIGILSLITVLQRIYYAYKQLS